MCYSATSATLRALKYAIHRGDENLAEQLLRELNELQILKDPRYYADAFSHPRLLVFTNELPFKPQAFTWGLIPIWCKSMEDAKKAWNTTLNARGETIFEKPSFKNSAKNKRCLIYLDAFYEHHHANKRTYPFRIKMKDGSPFAVAGLWEEWVDKATGEVFKTATVVTTTGNALMSKIHNNPAAEMGPRMPVILAKEDQDKWLMECKSETDQKCIQDLIKPFNAELMVAHTVGKLKGKEAIGNVPEVENEVVYPELSI